MPGPFSPIDEQIRHFFPAENHPYRKLERLIEAHITPDSTVLDIGCGREAPTLKRFRGKAARLIGIDVIDFRTEDGDLDLRRLDVTKMQGIDSGSVDVAWSRSVMEHVRDAPAAYREVARVLKPGGVYIFLTPNLWDYGSLVAWLVPNRFHPWIVRHTEGRQEEDTFPTHFSSNTKRRIRKLAGANGLLVEKLDYLNQYPNYLAFSRPLFYLGSVYARAVDRVPLLRPLSGWLLAVLRKPRHAGDHSAGGRP